MHREPAAEGPSPSLAEYLYRVSLEDPARLQLFIGPPLEEGAPEPNLGVLRAFVTGYLEAAGRPSVGGGPSGLVAHRPAPGEAGGDAPPDPTFAAGNQAVGHRDDGFLAWLREQGLHPPEGWARLLLRQAGGDHRQAIGAFFAHLHRFLLETRPPWFVAFNQAPRQSQLWPPDGRDLRLPEHVRAVGGR